MIPHSNFSVIKSDPSRFSYNQRYIIPEAKHDTEIWLLNKNHRFFYKLYADHNPIFDTMKKRARLADIKEHDYVSYSAHKTLQSALNTLDCIALWCWPRCGEA